MSGASSLPYGWQAAPPSAICYASSYDQATADLTNQYGPGDAAGYAFSGETFVTGNHCTTIPYGWYFHEGIRQTVNGLIIGQSYKITFYQSVVKQINLLDTSGSWQVYMNNTLIGVSDPSSSNLDYDSKQLLWDYRFVEFVATSASHTFTFLPFDDDDSLESSLTGFGSGVRMGIDFINLNKLDCLPPEFLMVNDTVICENDTLLIDAALPNCGYVWKEKYSDSWWTKLSANSKIEITESGTYSLQLYNNCGIIYDTINVLFIDCPGVLELPNVFTPNNDGINDLFEPIQFENILKVDLLILNRWGSAVYRSTGESISWDGKNSETDDLENGTYFWIVEYEDILGNIQKYTGTVVLLRTSD